MSSSTRLLRLLTLLQARERWSGPDLAGRLEISARTLRYDIGKLRGLGHVVDGGSGITGGYRLQAGSTLPPLALEDAEAVAVVLGLRLASGDGGELGESAATALAKFEQLMPARLRARTGALRGHTAAVPSSSPVTIDPGVVEFLTTACRDRWCVRFDYTTREGELSRREVEPYRVLQLDGRWYLSAFDPDRQDWRSFPLDRLRVRTPAGARFAARVAPEPAELVASIDAVLHRHRAVVVVEAPADRVAALVPAAVIVEAIDAGHSRVHASGAKLHDVAVHVMVLDRDFVVEQASEPVRRALRTIGRRAAEEVPRRADVDTGSARALVEPVPRWCSR